MIGYGWIDVGGQGEVLNSKVQVQENLGTTNKAIKEGTLSLKGRMHLIFHLTEMEGFLNRISLKDTDSNNLVECRMINTCARTEGSIIKWNKHC